MPKTLLAVDDSATMRKVLEITFGGEDFRVVTADGTQRALAQMSAEPAAVVIDTSLDGDPYGLAKEIRSRDARIAIVLLASRYNPYDAARGKDAGADDSIDKPFDTQALIDKVRKAMVAREGMAAPAPAPFVPAAPPAQPAVQPPAPPAAPAPAAISPFSNAPRPPGMAARPGFTPQRSHTLSFEGGPPVASPPPAPAVVVPGVPAGTAPFTRTAPSGIPAYQPPSTPQPAAVKPATASIPTAITAPTRQAPPAQQSPVATSAAPPQPSPQHSGVASAVNGQLAGKLGDLGLSPAQVEAVLALSREVVERVVWEVVPQLAETIIKEELTRLTRD